MRVGISARRAPGKLLIVGAAFFVMCFTAMMFVTRAAPIFRLRAADAAAQEVRRIVADAAGKTITSEINLVEKTMGSNGDVAMLSINSAQMNKLRADFTSELISQLSKSTKTTIYISFGSLLKNEIFQGAGIKIPAKITYGSISDVDFSDTFEAAGINQTRHLVTMKVTVTTAVISAFMCETRDIETSLPVCENIIMGKVPQYYSDRLGIAAKGE